jgi:hypothetical protein
MALLGLPRDLDSGAARAFDSAFHADARRVNYRGRGRKSVLRLARWKPRVHLRSLVPPEVRYLPVRLAREP